MLDLSRLHRIQLSARPAVQRFIGSTYLRLNYGLLSKVTIGFEGAEKVPDQPVIFAMNHTDRYNYWPFQYQWWRSKKRFTATWVKGKYYENAFVGGFMERTNNIPTVSRGYLITKDFILTMGRHPSGGEYNALRGWVDAVWSSDDSSAPDTPAGLPQPVYAGARSMFGRRFDPAAESYPQAICGLFETMMNRFVELNTQAFELGLDVLVFPEGTRSRSLGRGHIGLAEMALHVDKPVVPVGCSGSDLLYPGSSPWAKPGKVTYRFGEPLTPADLSRFKPPEPFRPFSAMAEKKYRASFQGCVDVIMERVNDLVDGPYKRAQSDKASGGAARNVRRFV